MTRSRSAPEIPKYPEPYLKYQSRQNRRDRFHDLAQLSIEFTAFNLVQTSEEDLKKVKIPRPDLKRPSMIPRAARAKEAHLMRGWVTHKEYAKVSGLELQQVEEFARRGDLGPQAVVPETGEEVLFWPPEEHPKGLAGLPAPTTKKSYKVVITNKAFARSDSLDTREMFLKLASSHGDPKESSEHALALLRQVSFIQEWSSFEVFLREIAAFLLRKHPEKLGASKGKKAEISVDEVVEMSKGSTSIEELREKMVQREIDRRQEEGQSVQGLMNFLKDEFRFQRDPYREPYICSGQQSTTHYNDLAEIKDVRNALIHDGGFVQPEFFEL